MMTDTEVILIALQKERDELHDKIMQVDRIIKRVKSLDYSTESAQQPVKEIAANGNDKPLNLFPKTADIKVQVLRVFDLIRKAAKLSEVQSGYNQLSGNTYNIRETVRSLHQQRLLRQIKIKHSNRGILWVKSEWLENNVLAEDHKPDGFDLLYKAENLIYE